MDMFRIPVTLEQWNAMKANPYYYDTSPEEDAKPPEEREADRQNWIKAIRSNPDAYATCPFSFSDMPCCKAFISIQPSFYS